VQRIIMDFVIWREKKLSLMAHLVCMFVVKRMFSLSFLLQTLLEGKSTFVWLLSKIFVLLAFMDHIFFYAFL
jgi:hypothetical protein